VCALSRHGTSLTARLGDLTAAFAEAPPGSVFDGELVVVSERGGRPVRERPTARVSGRAFRPWRVTGRGLGDRGFLAEVLEPELELVERPRLGRLVAHAASQSVSAALSGVGGSIVAQARAR
jgi:hypothetical protein